MNTHRSNASVVAVLVILLVIAGVIYLFWQNQKAVPEALETPVVEETAPAPAESATTESAETEASVEVEASTAPAE